jgi:hypothetical protein
VYGLFRGAVWLMTAIPPILETLAKNPEFMFKGACVVMCVGILGLGIKRMFSHA